MAEINEIHWYRGKLSDYGNGWVYNKMPRKHSRRVIIDDSVNQMKMLCGG